MAAAPVNEISDLTIQVAEYKLLLAEQHGGSWVNTQTLIEEAKRIDATGDYSRALEVARQARFESEAALTQNMKQQQIKPWQF
ncbi:MAG: hypothetical protein L3J62_01920 [Gammaproteobacteria bacterium]|nr:hypothetical protein [Gammaproteobacteria bacterium]